MCPTAREKQEDEWTQSKFEDSQKIQQLASKDLASMIRYFVTHETNCFVSLSGGSSTGGLHIFI